MSGLDVEALLDSTANAISSRPEKSARPSDGDDRHKHERNEKRERDRHRDASRDRDRERKRRDRSRDRGRRDRGIEPDDDLKSPSDRASNHGRHRTGRRSRSRDSHRRNSGRDRARDYNDREDSYRSSGGDYYRGGVRPRTRSKSPDEDRYYRPSGRGRRDRDGESDKPRDIIENGRGKESARRGSRSKSASPQLTEDERDRRTVFVQQLAARLRTKELIAFFEKVGPVKEAQIVKDRVSGRSKGLVHLSPPSFIAC